MRSAPTRCSVPTTPPTSRVPPADQLVRSGVRSAAARCRGVSCETATRTAAVAGTSRTQRSASSVAAPGCGDPIHHAVLPLSRVCSPFETISARASDGPVSAPRACPSAVTVRSTSIARPSGSTTAPRIRTAGAEASSPAARATVRPERSGFVTASVVSAASDTSNTPSRPHGPDLRVRRVMPPSTRTGPERLGWIGMSSTVNRWTVESDPLLAWDAVAEGTGWWQPVVEAGERTGAFVVQAADRLHYDRAGDGPFPQFTAGLAHRLGPRGPFLLDLRTASVVAAFGPDGSVVEHLAADLGELPAARIAHAPPLTVYTHDETAGAVQVRVTSPSRHLAAVVLGPLRGRRPVPTISPTTASSPPATDRASTHSWASWRASPTSPSTGAPPIRCSPTSSTTPASISTLPRPSTAPPGNPSARPASGTCRGRCGAPRVASPPIRRCRRTARCSGHTTAQVPSSTAPRCSPSCTGTGRARRSCRASRRCASRPGRSRTSCRSTGPAAVTVPG